jgi:hypothetical protein
MLAVLCLAPGIIRAQENPDDVAIAKVKHAGGQVYRISAAESFREICFHLSSSPVGDEQIALAANVPEVIWLNIAGTKITNDGLKAVGGMKQLRRLHLEKTQIDDVGLEHLLGLTELEYLNLYGTKVTDAGISKLAGLKNLKRLYLWQSLATEKGQEDLRAAMPQCEIVGEVKLTPVAPLETKVEPTPEKPAEPKAEEKKDDKTS